MKKIINIVLLSAFVTVLSISCNKDGDPTPPRAISFGKVATRAALSDIQKDGFGVWAIIDNAEYTKHPLMNNVYVHYNGGVWEYSPEEYWIADTRFSFVATYPYDDDGTNFKLDSDSDSGAVMLSVLETPSVVDYLMATEEVDTATEGFPEEAVELQFKHMLTNVSLNIWRDQGKHQNDQMRIIKVTLSNICKDGTYSTSSDAWTPTGNKLTLSYENDNLSDSDNIGAVTIKDDGTLDAGGSKPLTPFAEQLLIPQIIDESNNVSLKIEYDLKRQNAADWESAELETILPNITWESGRRYTYNVVLSSVTDITVYYIQTKVDPWGTPQVGGTVIIK